MAEWGFQLKAARLQILPLLTMSCLIPREHLVQLSHFTGGKIEARSETQPRPR